MTTAEDLDRRIEGQNVPARFLANLAARPDTTVLRWKDGAGEWTSLTLSEMADHVARLTTGLKDLGVKRGDRVVLMLTNRQEFHALDLAVLFCGATPVSIYNSSAPSQIDYLVNNCEASVAILEGSVFLGRFGEVRDKLTTIEHIVVVDPDESTGDDVVRYSDLLAHEPADLDVEARTAQPEDLATIIYTSGTTGDPKGVMLSHRNVCWTLESMSDGVAIQTEFDSLSGKRHVSYLPMAHIMERLLGHYFMVDVGTEVTCCPVTTQVAAYAAEVHPHFFIGVPRVWEKIYAGVNAVLAADPEKAGPFNEAVAAAGPIREKMTAGTATEEEIETYNFLDAVAFSQVRPLVGLDEAMMCISGAAPIPPEILSWFRTIGVPLAEGYGMSETTAVLTWSHAAKAGTVGQPGVGIELKLGEDGEVLARGGNMFEGYLGLPEQTAATMDPDGWVHTGDIGELDEDGYLRIVDRKKELIITAGGKNISPANLEAAMKMIPLVGQACAIGEKRPFVSALVVLDPDACAVWAASKGLGNDASSPSALADNPEVVAEIEEGLKAAMSGFNGAESVKKVKILGDEWLPDSELLTPTSKLKRRGINAAFAQEIEELYAK